MKIALLALLVLTTALATDASASITETEPEIEKRYGPADKNDFSPGLGMLAKTHHFKAFTVQVIYLDGKSSAEIFTKAPLEKFSDAEVASILEANSTGKKWIGGEAADLMNKTWRLEDKSIAAIWDTMLSKVTVCTRGMIPKISSITKEEETKNPNSY